nr:uncharacterized protein LOC110375608 isoform X1 [Helicoverpa armigera]
MLRLLKICFLIYLHYNLVKCSNTGGDDLSVRKLDKKMIERKRQDTREMCKIFNSQQSKIKLIASSLPHGKYDKARQELKEKKEIEKQKMRRVKRDAEMVVTPVMKADDDKRVEDIVDRLYDDLLEKGQNISYRKRAPKTEETISTVNKTGRRFPFAPLSIEAKLSSSSKGPSEPAYSKIVPRFKHAIIPYFIDSRTYDTHLSEIIMKAFDYIEKATCVRLQRLRERPTDLQSLQNVVWLYITNPNGIRQCVHTNERMEIKGVRMIVFGYDCMTLGDIAHEIMHVLGFAHEHVRPDRDQYIKIMWDNIKPGYKKYFELNDKPIVENLPYDYASVLHYPARAFSKNGQVTILTEPGIKVGQREGLSEVDVEKIGMLYSNECVLRNREYLLKTCPSVIKADMKPTHVTQQEIDDYFEDRLWSYGVVNYKLLNKMEFTAEELENIKAVINHLEKETCIEFRDLTPYEDEAKAMSAADDASNSDYDYEDVPSDDFVPHFNSTATDIDLEEALEPGRVMRNEIKDNNVKGFKGRQGINGKNKYAKYAGAKRRVTPIGSTAKVNITGAPGKVNNSGVRSNIGNGNAKGKVIPAIAKTKPDTVGAKGNDAYSSRKPITNRRKRAATPKPARRHAESVVVLSRSPKPGCKCPRPGKPDGNYTLKINTDCFNSVNDLLHVFVHVLGLDHQHNMHDRDSYLHIIWDQLTDDVKQEMKRKLPPAASVGFQYDYQSVMHYPWLQIKNGRTNIMYPIWNDGWAMGHWQGLSATDVQKLNMLYFKQCVARKQEAEQPETTDKTTRIKA